MNYVKRGHCQEKTDQQVSYNDRLKIYTLKMLFISNVYTNNKN